MRAYSCILSLTAPEPFSGGAALRLQACLPPLLSASAWLRSRMLCDRCLIPLRLIPLALRQPWHVMQTNAQCHAYRVTSWVRQMSQVLHEEIPAKGEGIRGLQSMLTAVAAGVLRQKSHAQCEEHSADAVRTYRSNSAGSHAMKACAPAAPACPHQRPACPAPSSAPAWRHSPAPGSPPGCAAGSRMLPGGDCRVPAAASPCYCCCSGLEGLYSDAGF